MLGSGVAATVLGLVGDPSFMLLAIGVTAISAVALLTAPARGAALLSSRS